MHHLHLTFEISDRTGQFIQMRNWGNVCVCACVWKRCCNRLQHRNVQSTKSKIYFYYHCRHRICALWVVSWLHATYFHFILSPIKNRYTHILQFPDLVFLSFLSFALFQLEWKEKHKSGMGNGEKVNKTYETERKKNIWKIEDDGGKVEYAGIDNVRQASIVLWVHLKKLE